MADAPGGEAYRIHVWIRQISPMIWRRLLVDSDSSIADLHHTLQIAFGWSDCRILISIGSTSMAGITASARSAGSASRPMQIKSASPTFAFVSTNDSGTNTTSATPGSTKCESSESAAGQYRRLSSLHWRPSPSAPGRLRRSFGVHGAARSVADSGRRTVLAASRGYASRRSGGHSRSAGRDRLLVRMAGARNFRSASGQPSAQAIRDERRGLDVPVGIWKCNRRQR
jgi:hypothetical protein